MCEESADEDIIRFDVATVEEMTLESDGLTIPKDIATGGAAIINNTAVFFADAVTSAVRIRGETGTGLDLQHSGEAAYLWLRDTQSMLLGTDNTTSMVLTSDGEVTKPRQPAFEVQIGTSQTNLTIGNYTTIHFDTENFDIGANFNTSTWTFTAPVTGKYVFSWFMSLNDWDSATTYYGAVFVTSNKTYFYHRGGGIHPDNADYTFMSDSAIVEMDANDTVYMQIVVHNSGASQMDVMGSASARYSYLMGYLLG